MTFFMFTSIVRNESSFWGILLSQVLLSIVRYSVVFSGISSSSDVTDGFVISLVHCLIAYLFQVEGLASQNNTYKMIRTQTHTHAVYMNGAQWRCNTYMSKLIFTSSWNVIRHNSAILVLIFREHAFLRANRKVKEFQLQTYTSDYR